MSVGVVNGGAVSEVTNCLTGILRATEEDSVATLGGTESELIESDALTTSLGDSGSVRLNTS